MNQAAATVAEPNKGGAPIGNQHALKGKRIRDAILKELGRRGHGDIDKGLEPVVKKLVTLAHNGEQWAMQELFNRIEGRIPAAVELTGANGGDLVVRDANTSMGIARRVAFVLASGALAKANGTWGKAEVLQGGDTPAP